MFADLFYAYNLTYAQSIALIGFLNGLVFGLALIVASYLIYRLSLVLKRRAAKIQVGGNAEQLLKNKSVDLDSASVDLRSFFEAEKAKNRKSKCTAHQVLYVFSSILSWFGTILLGITPSILSGLGLIPIPVSILLTLIGATCKYFGLVNTYCPNFIKTEKDRTYDTCLSKVKRYLKRAAVTTKFYKYRFSAYIIIAVIFSFGLPLFTWGSCLTFFNTSYGIGNSYMHFSSKFTRYVELDTVCPQGKICHTYATLPEDSSSSVFINIHTGNDISALQVNYDTLANHQASPAAPLNYSATTSSYYTDLETRGDRYVHSAYLGNLTNNTMYYFEIIYNGMVQGYGTYRTLPSKNMEKNITMVAGGDVGNTPVALQMTATVKGYSPDVILIGGDLAYDNGISSCYYSYDLFLNMLASLSPNPGQLIPYTFSIGNHDVGFNAMKPASIDITKNLYNLYFPQHSIADSQGIAQAPELADRLSYSYHVIGNTIHMSLDSGYMTDYGGSQLDFLKSSVANFTDYVKFANYHVPINSVCLNSDNEITTQEEPQMYWAPIFQKHRFATIFENHAHLFKKTYPLVNGQPSDSPNAVIYVGDGNWGVTPMDCIRDQSKDIFEYVDLVNNIWIVNLSNTMVTVFAIDEEGNQLLDEPINLNVSDYIGY